MPDVTPETPETPAEPTTTVTPEVTPQTTPVDPYAQRFERMERMIASIAQGYSQMQANQVQPDAKGPQDLKDEELWSLAQQGNRQAFELYQERIADRRFTQRITQRDQEQVVGGQLTALYQQYPELSNPQNPLTQRAIVFKNALVQMGEPNNRKTDLDAILRAIADSRDILSPRTASPVRQATPTGQMGASHRQPDATPTDQTKVSAEEASLAKKMGNRDPGKAIKKFWERQENGTSSVSPTVIAAVERQK